MIFSWTNESDAIVRLHKLRIVCDVIDMWKKIYVCLFGWVKNGL